MKVTPEQKKLIIQALNIAGLQYYNSFTDLMKLSRIDNGVEDEEIKKAGLSIYARCNAFYDLAQTLKSLKQ